MDGTSILLGYNNGINK